MCYNRHQRWRFFFFRWLTGGDEFTVWNNWLQKFGGTKRKLFVFQIRNPVWQCFFFLPPPRGTLNLEPWTVSSSLLSFPTSNSEFWGAAWVVDDGPLPIQLHFQHVLSMQLMTVSDKSFTLTIQRIASNGTKSIKQLPHPRHVPHSGGGGLWSMPGNNSLFRSSYLCSTRDFSSMDCVQTIWQLSNFNGPTKSTASICPWRTSLQPRQPFYSQLGQLSICNKQLVTYKYQETLIVLSEAFKKLPNFLTA